ncbi:tetratricopeptide repeat protein [Hyphobacterium sp.]|uniref:tetratricopeptide repeat protein n=1 Tax=Hyphobacterium sp. TaxID=2004662 RepID=UPI003BA9D492
MIALAVFVAIAGFALATFVVWPAARVTPRWLAPALTAGIVLIAGVAYLVNGQPGQPGSPYGEAARERLAADPSTLNAEAREERWRDLIRQDASNAEAWAQLGRGLARRERELEAINAFQRSLRLELDAQTLSDLGQTFINLNEGEVTSEAVAAFEEARTLDPDLPEPGFFLGLAAFQEGRVDAAEAIWLDLIARLDERSPYRILIAQQAFQLLSQPQVDSAAVASAAEDEAFDPALRIAEMVSRLETRVEGGEAGFADRLRLIRVYGLLQREDEARAALLDARRAFLGNEGAMVILDILMAALAIEEDDTE